MTKATTPTIYPYLNSSFWTQHQCTKCQTFFTLQDYHTQNYQLTFKEILKVEQNHLSALVQLTHKSCCSGCLNYLKDLYQTKLKTHD